MSNIARKNIKVGEGVTVSVMDGRVVVAGPKGELSAKIPYGISLNIGDGEVAVKKLTDAKDFEKYAGLARALVANMVQGVTTGFEKKLELTGVGYRARVEGADLVLNVGYSIPVKVKPLPGVAIKVDENIITVQGPDKQLVGDTASNIRKVRPPDPYKGKGIKYVGEYLRRKVGKAAKAVGTK
jgi:large subunit ribosomal protein L6